jgi:hypothetical protein
MTFKEVEKLLVRPKQSPKLGELELVQLVTFAC